ncbi:MAG: hypothetical protein J5641_04655 [Bacteroidales bacterium]|nr:hypothetical protein [Bacteroidales bacterium]
MKRFIPLIITILTLILACEQSEYTTRITGTIYTDSTLTVPVANDTVWFYDYDLYADHHDSTRHERLLGHALTDSEGRFGFLDWNIDISSYDPRYESKFQFEYGNFIIIHRPDTLFCGEYNGQYNGLILFPGKYSIHPNY